MLNQPADCDPNQPSLYQELSRLPSHLAFGKLRRKVIREFFTKNPGIAVPVNCCSGIQIKNDRDLKDLLKAGFLKKFRSLSWHSTQFIKLND
jgi:hypothetical protein